jgi:hypothetical protein
MKMIGLKDKFEQIDINNYKKQKKYLIIYMNKTFFL